VHAALTADKVNHGPDESAAGESLLLAFFISCRAASQALEQQKQQYNESLVADRVLFHSNSSDKLAE
jgi:hypothetical protein